MIQTILAKIVGTQNERDLKKLRPIVGQVGAFEPAIQALTDEQLRGKTAEPPPIVRLQPDFARLPNEDTTYDEITAW